MPQKLALQESIKKEILADLDRESSYQTNPAVISAIKDDILAELEGGQKSPSYSRKLTATERELIKQNVLRELSGDDYNLRGAVDKTVVENIKNELLAELAGPQYGNWRSVLSQRNLDRRINRQYSDLRNLRQEIRRGLETARDTEQRLENIRDPYVREAVHSIIEEARYEGIPLDLVISRLNAGDNFSGGLGQRMGGWLSSGTAKGFLGGIGASFLVSLLFPAARGSLRNMGIRMMEGTMDLADQTRSTFGRAREGFEDMIAEANFNNLQESEEFSQAEEPTTPPQDPLEDNPLH